MIPADLNTLGAALVSWLLTYVIHSTILLSAAASDRREETKEAAGLSRDLFVATSWKKGLSVELDLLFARSGDQPSLGSKVLETYWIEHRSSRTGRKLPSGEHKSTPLTLARGKGWSP